MSTFTPPLRRYLVYPTDSALFAEEFEATEYAINEDGVLRFFNGDTPIAVVAAGQWRMVRLQEAVPA